MKYLLITAMKITKVIKFKNTKSLINLVNYLEEQPKQNPETYTSIYTCLLHTYTMFISTFIIIVTTFLAS